MFRVIGVEGHGSIVDGAIAFKANGAPCFRYLLHTLSCLFSQILWDRYLLEVVCLDPSGR